MAVLLLVGLSRVTGSLPQEVSILHQRNHDGVFGERRQVLVLSQPGSSAETQLSMAHGLCPCVWAGLQLSWIMLISGSAAGRDCLYPFPKQWAFLARGQQQKLLIFSSGWFSCLCRELCQVWHGWGAQPNQNPSALLQMLRANSQEPTSGSLTVWAL